MRSRHTLLGIILEAATVVYIAYTGKTDNKWAIFRGETSSKIKAGRLRSIWEVGSKLDLGEINCDNADGALLSLDRQHMQAVQLPGCSLAVLVPKSQINILSRNLLICTVLFYTAAVMLWSLLSRIRKVPASITDPDRISWQRLFVTFLSSIGWNVKPQLPPCLKKQLVTSRKRWRSIGNGLKGMTIRNQHDVKMRAEAY
jgi:hypothetical protein